MLRGTARTPSPGAAASPKSLTKVALATEPVWGRNPANQPKFILPIISLRHIDTSLWQNQSRPSA